MKKENIPLLLTVGLFLVVGFLVYRFWQINRLQTVRVVKGELTSSVFASGKTKVEKEANLTFKSTGRIIYLPVVKNQTVKKGQVVATIDTSDLAAAQEKELQDYLKTRWDFEQTTRDTYRDQALTDTIKRTKEKAQFDLNKSVLEVEIADRALKNASLYAPFDGLVTAVNGELNEWTSVFSTSPLVTIVEPTTVYFEAEMEEEDMGKIAIGQETTVTLDAYPAKEFVGKVAEIDKKSVVKDNGDTVLPVKITFNLNESQPLIGLNGDAQFILERKKDILLLPKRAVKKMDNHSLVIVKRGILLKDVMVETGASDARSIEILKGVSESDQVVMPSELE